MFAIFETGGKQYRAQAGDILEVEKLPEEEGKKVSFKRVYLIAGDKTEVGTPYVEGAQVNATIVKHDKGEKVRVVKFQAKKRHSTEQGHRQLFTQIKVDEVLPGGSIKVAKKEEKKVEQAEKVTTESE